MVAKRYISRAALCVYLALMQLCTFWKDLFWCYFEDNFFGGPTFFPVTWKLVDSGVSSHRESVLMPLGSKSLKPLRDINEVRRPCTFSECSSTLCVVCCISAKFLLHAPSVRFNFRQWEWDLPAARIPSALHEFTESAEPPECSKGFQLRFLFLCNGNESDTTRGLWWGSARWDYFGECQRPTSQLFYSFCLLLYKNTINK